jgi:hypothetical protein
LKNTANAFTADQLSFVHSDALPVSRKGFFCACHSLGFMWFIPIFLKYLSSLVDNAQDTIPAHVVEEKCSTWNVFVEREYPFFSVCGKLFFLDWDEV